MMVAVDTETDGLDIRHGCRPFFVTVCYEDGKQVYWEWEVNPLTRFPIIPKSDVREIEGIVISNDLVLQNSKFDFTALASIGVSFSSWCRVRDTLIAGHLLGSNLPHDLTSMVLQYLGEDILPYENALKMACNEARRLARSEFPTWKIAKEGDSKMPSIKGSSRLWDGWLPRAIAKEKGYPESHSWWTVLRDYANADSEHTLVLWAEQRKELERRGLWKIYQERMKLLPIAYEMERRGVTLSKTRLEELRGKFIEDSDRAEAVCLNIAKDRGCELELPKSGNNKSLTSFIFNVLELPAVKRSDKTGEPSLDKSCIDHYLATLPQKSKELLFMKSLAVKRGVDTAITYLNGYERFWLPEPDGELFRLHPQLNITGTDTLRWSSNNPNSQNISKKEKANLRYCFGPGPRREWWSMDGKNLELRIPAYESGEKDLIHVFDHPDDPPYYGSYHLFVFDVLHPALFEQHGKKVKDMFESTWYQWVKNGNFAIIYGAQMETADRAYHCQGAYDKIQSRFPKIAALNDRQKRLADQLGYVITIPDKSVDPERGYPLLCTRTEWGRVMPTVPLNYHVSGTAMWWTARAMVRCEEKLREWRAEDFDGFMTLQCHDELVFDFPKIGNPVKNPVGHLPSGVSTGPKLPAWKQSNLWRARILQKLMEEGGKGIGVPTPVSCEYHETTWDKGETL